MDYKSFDTHDLRKLLSSPFVQNVLKPIALLIGSFYIAKAFVSLTLTINHFVKAYLVAKIDTRYCLRKEYGDYVIITNVTDVLGTEFAKAFLTKGHSLVLIVTMDDKKLEHVMPQLEEYRNIGGGEIAVITKDSTNGDINMYKTLKEKLKNARYKKKIGVLLNNAGFFNNHDEKFLRSTDEYVLDMLQHRVTDFVMITKAVLEVMYENKRGLIVNVTNPDDCHFLALDIGFPQKMRKFTDEFNKTVREEYSDFKNLEIEAIHPGCIHSEEHSNEMTLNPTPDEFVKSAMSTLGRVRKSSGYPYHSVRNCFKYFVPNFIKQMFTYLNTPQQQHNQYNGYTVISDKNDSEIGLQQ